MCLFLWLREHPPAGDAFCLCNNKPDVTQSWPLAVISSQICANASWQLARHDVVWPGPRLALQAIAAFTGWRSSTCYTATAALSALYKDPSIRPQLPWRWRLRLISCQAGRSALPHPWVSGVKEGGRFKRQISAKEEQLFTSDRTGKYQIFHYCNNHLQLLLKTWELIILFNENLFKLERLKRIVEFKALNCLLGGFEDPQHVNVGAQSFLTYVRKYFIQTKTQAAQVKMCPSFIRFLQISKND